MTKKAQIGRLGEEIVCKFLRKEGFKILDRNHLKPWGEIDIVAQRRGIVHFVEVKSVSCEMFSRETVRPEENMHENKIKRLKRVIQTYLSEKHISRETLFQADLITVRIDLERGKALVERFGKVF